MVDPPTGVPIQLHPLVTRVLAPNASAYTHTGTQSYIVGETGLVIIDPGPDDSAHLKALLNVVAGRPVTAILVTHHHRDHSPASRPLSATTGAPVIGAAPFARDDAETGADAAFDERYAPDRVLDDRETLRGEGWALTAIATPGHTSNHLCYALEGAGVLFSGDHVMGWATSVVSPPDGDMGDYMASLEKLLARDDRVYYPGHGEAVENPRRLVRGMLGHRKQREGQILRLLAAGDAPVPIMVERMYAGLDQRLMPAAERSVLAHLYDLRARGLVVEAGDEWRRAA